MRREFSKAVRVAAFERARSVLCDRILAKSMPEPNSGCWIWLGASKANGYGHMWDGSRLEIAHRLSYRLFVGSIPDGHVVMHRCDMPCCVNPDHLTTGTPYDNMHDCIDKGRARRGRFIGETNPAAKLTLADILAIRSEPRKYGYRQRLAARYGVAPGTISQIVSGETWSES